jgi:hypothetical protein
MATCGLLDAAFMRFPVPDAWFETGWFYAALDALVLIAIGRDLIIERRVHPAYAIGLTGMMAGQLIAWSLWQHPPALWMSLCRALVGVG